MTVHYRATGINANTDERVVGWRWSPPVRRCLPSGLIVRLPYRYDISKKKNGHVFYYRRSDTSDPSSSWESLRRNDVRLHRIRSPSRNTRDTSTARHDQYLRMSDFGRTVDKLNELTFHVWNTGDIFERHFFYRDKFQFGGPLPSFQFTRTKHNRTNMAPSLTTRSVSR